MTNSVQANPSTSGRFRTSLLGGLAIHAVAVMVFFVCVGLLGGSCSQDATIGAGLFFAVVADLVLLGGFVVLRRRRLSVPGLAVSMVPAVVLLVIGLAALNAAGSGCPV